MDTWRETSERGPRTGRVEKVSQSVAREIVASIIDGHLEPGSVLPSEAEMVDAYRVGRASVREALRLLEAQGLVAMKPGPGGGPIVGAVGHAQFGSTATFFFQLAGATYADILQARSALEPMMIRNLAETRPAEPLQQLAAVMPRDGDDDATYVALATELHSIVARCTTNPVLNLVTSAITHVYADRVPGASFPQKRREQVAREHRAVIEAVLAGRADAAEAAMRAHMASMSADVHERCPGLLDETVDWR